MSTMAFLLRFLCLVAVAMAQSNCPVDTYDASKDYFPIKVSPQFSQYWSITYNKNYKVLTNSLANETYVLTMCNTPQPSAKEFSGKVRFFTIPVNHVGSSSRSTVSFLERLGVRDTLKYVASTSIMTSPCLLNMVDSKSLIAFPLNGTPSGIEVNFARGPGPAQVNASVDAITSTLSAVWEDNPLQKLEWVQFVSAFYNLESQGSLAFQKTVATYTCQAQNVVKQGQRKPIIAWLTALDDGTFVTVDWTYRTQLILDAGGTALVSPSVASLGDVQTSLLDADIVIDDTPNIQTYDDFLKAYGMQTQTSASKTTGQSYHFLTNKQVYKTDRKRNEYGIDDFPESAWTFPESVQSDLIHAIYPSFNPAWKSVYLRNLAKGEQSEVQSGTMCDASQVAVPLTPPSITCIPNSGSSSVQSTSSTTVNVGAVVGGTLAAVAVVSAASAGLFIYGKRRQQKYAMANQDEKRSSRRSSISTDRHALNRLDSASSLASTYASVTPSMRGSTSHPALSQISTPRPSSRAKSQSLNNLSDIYNSSSSILPSHSRDDIFDIEELYGGDDTDSIAPSASASQVGRRRDPEIGKRSPY